jgi:hypothetical protein
VLARKGREETKYGRGRWKDGIVESGRAEKRGEGIVSMYWDLFISSLLAEE